MGITVEKTELDEVLLIKPSVFEDHRGLYVETFNRQDYEKNNINIDFVRDDISTSRKNVLRGIHYDDKTWKLIHCMHGKIYFVVVNMKKNSRWNSRTGSFCISSPRPPLFHRAIPPTAWPWLSPSS